MEFSKISSWNKQLYKEYIDYLKSIQDIKYKEFHSSLVFNSKYEMIGIRLPTMRQIAKDISKTNIEEFLSFTGEKYYEEIMIKGLVISKLKDEDTFYKCFNEFIKQIDNWAICDSFCSSIKIIEKYEDKYFEIATNLALQKDEFLSRVGLIMILNHFINEEHLDSIYDTLNTINSEKYYINMAEAWLVCELYIKYPKETFSFIKDNNLNKFTQNKAISKIHDSYRVSTEEKDLLNKYRK